MARPTPGTVNTSTSLDSHTDALFFICDSEKLEVEGPEVVFDVAPEYDVCVSTVRNGAEGNEKDK